MSKLTRTTKATPPARSKLRGPESGARVVGRWELGELAGEGELSRVYRARAAGSTPEARASYAVKLLRQQWHGQPQVVAMFRREAALTREFSHPHLVSVLEARTDGPPYWLVMPWLEGRTLAAMLARGERIELPVALWLVRQVAEALDALHAAGWMHADLKPANILVSPDGHATLLDLSFARPLDGPATASERCVVGTPHYMAPEMAASGPVADRRSDLYSLGVVLFQLLTGRLPIEGESLAAVVRRHCESRPQDVRRLAADLPAEIAQLVRSMLSKEPVRRPQTPGEVIERLLRLEIATFAQRNQG